MANSFLYREVDPALREDFVRHLEEQGESIVLLGARHLTKLNSIRDVYQRLVNKQLTNPIVYLNELHERPIVTRKQLFQLLKKGVEYTAKQNQFAILLENEQDFFDPIVQLHKICKQPVILLMTNVDNMPHHLVEELLRRIRVYVEKRQLIVALTGDRDLQDLLYGPNSVFDIAHQYVLQGLTKDYMYESIQCIVETSDYRFEEPEQACENIWNLVRGSVYFARLMLRYALFRPEGARHPLNPNTPLKIPTSWLPGLEDFLSNNSLINNEVFVTIERSIASQPESLPHLEELIAEGEILRIPLQQEPTILELAGIAIRDISGRRLTFTSPLIREFVTNHYSPRRRADFFLRNGQIDRGFELAEKIPVEERLRPVSREDGLELIETITALQQTLLALASTDITGKKIQSLFVQTCRYVFGLPHVSFWEKGETWTCLHLVRTERSEYKTGEILRLLRLINRYTRSGVQIIKQDSRLKNNVIFAVLPTIHPARQEALIVGDLSSANPWAISRERRRLIEDFIQIYVQALVITTERQRQEADLKQRNLLRDILGIALMETRLEGRSPEAIVRKVAQGLKGNEYKRVLVSLVDPKRDYIEGIVDATTDSLMDVAQYTKYRLNEPLKDIQPYVVATNTTKVVSNATEEPLTNKDVVKSANMQSFVLVPIQNKAGTCIGTIHVERADNLVPSEDEVSNLEIFGQQLGVLLEQSRQLGLFEKAIQKLETPIFIYDAKGQLRYINQYAAVQVGCVPGWYENEEPVSSLNLEDQRTYVQEAMSTGIRFARNVDEVLSSELNTFKIVVPLISNNSVIGSVLEARDISANPWMISINIALSNAIDELSAIIVLIQAIKSRSDQFAEQRWQLFRSYDNSITVRMFPDGKIKTETAYADTFDPNDISDLVEPKLFYFSTYDLKKEFSTYGIRLLKAESPPMNIDVDDEVIYWVDAPVIVSGKPYGKIQVQYEDDVKPEQLYRLKLMMQLLEARLAAFKQEADKRFILQQSFEHAFDYLTHSLGNRYSLFTAVFSDYLKAYESLGKPPVLKATNERMSRAGERFIKFIEGARLLLSSAKLEMEPTQIKLFIKDIMEYWFPETKYCVEGDEAWVAVDRQLFDDVFIELVTNSQKAASGEVVIEILIKQTPQGAKVSYLDNGPGIAAEISEKIFLPYFTERPSETGGRGLGLPYIKEIVERHGGNIALDSLITQGARFIITLPPFDKE